MTTRILGALAVVSALLTTAAWGQAESAIKQGGSPPVPLSQLIADLKAQAPYTRNGAAYELAHMGPAAAPAVPRETSPAGALQSTQPAAVRVTPVASPVPAPAAVPTVGREPAKVGGGEPVWPVAGRRPQTAASRAGGRAPSPGI